jgi:hypothetical protein
LIGGGLPLPGSAISVHWPGLTLAGSGMPHPGLIVYKTQFLDGANVELITLR